MGMEDEKKKHMQPLCLRQASFPFWAVSRRLRMRREFFRGVQPVSGSGRNSFRDEAEELNEKLDEISHDQEFDVTAALVNSLGGSSVQDYADDLYDMCDFGYGADRDGVLLLVSLEDHDWYISTSGYGITAFTDAGIQYIGEQIKPDLADGNYLDAFETYADQCDNFINQANSGEPYDVDHMPKEPLSPILVWNFLYSRTWRRAFGGWRQ